MAIVMLAGVPPAPAQFMRDHEAEGGVRGFHGTGRIGRITRSFQSDTEADAEFKRILSTVGLGYVVDRITLRATPQTPNAEAFVSKDGSERFIFYNPSFMQLVRQKTAEHWSLVSILAHEVGHHVAFHTVIEGHNHKFELEADYFSGFVLRRLGATLDQAEAATRLISPKSPGPTHPGLDDRLAVITLGWTDGGAAGAPPGLKVAKEAAAMPQNAAADAVRVCREVEGMSSFSMLGVLASQHEGTPAGDCIATRLAELKQAEDHEKERVALLAKRKADEEGRRADEERKRAEAERLVLQQKRAEAEAKRETGEAARRAPAPLTAAEEPALKPGDSFKECDACAEMVVVPAGSFMMGSPPGEVGRHLDEGPQHKVTIARLFAVGKFEVTRAEFETFVGESGHAVDDECKTYETDSWKERTGRSFRNPGYGQDDRHPAVCASWNDAQAYVRWLSRKTGKSYRLLSEAEWEYVARAGTTARYHFGNNQENLCDYGNVADETAGKHWTGARCSDAYVHTAPAGSIWANAFKLHDMHGNVWEWVEDCWNAGYEGAPTDGSAWTTGDCSLRVYRGGSFDSDPSFLRSAFRNWGRPVLRRSHLGFRVARTL